MSRKGVATRSSSRKSSKEPEQRPPNSDSDSSLEPEEIQQKKKSSRARVHHSKSNSKQPRKSTGQSHHKTKPDSKQKRDSRNDQPRKSRGRPRKSRSSKKRKERESERDQPRPFQSPVDAVGSVEKQDAEGNNQPLDQPKEQSFTNSRPRVDSSDRNQENRSEIPEYQTKLHLFKKQESEIIVESSLPNMINQLKQIDKQRLKNDNEVFDKSQIPIQDDQSQRNNLPAQQNFNLNDLAKTLNELSFSQNVPSLQSQRFQSQKQGEEEKKTDKVERNEGENDDEGDTQSRAKIEEV